MFVTVTWLKVKKEIIITSLLAISLALGLGIVSLGLFGAAPPTTTLETLLDVYTQKGGIGSNVSGGTFQPPDEVSVYAHLTRGGIELNSTDVTFTIRTPGAEEIPRAATTNGSGIAHTTFSLLPSEGHILGTWHVTANATVDSKSAEDTLTLLAQVEDALLTLNGKRNGATSTIFLPNETVVLEAQVLYRNASMTSITINFTVRIPSGATFLTNTTSADTAGGANVTFQIPWPSDSSLGIWQATAQAEVYEKLLNATTSFECKLLPVTIDVYTQQGGYGPNSPGGTFLVNDTVYIYAEVRDELNNTVPYVYVSFEVRDPANQSAYRTQQTDLSGIANITHRVSEGGTYQVYVVVQYDQETALDTLILIANQS
jgi:hypothetical protein